MANFTAKKLSILWVLNAEMHIRIESSFYGNELINLPGKILMEQCLLIGISISFTLPSIFNHWFNFSSDSHSYEASSSSKDLLKVKTVNTK